MNGATLILVAVGWSAAACPAAKGNEKQPSALDLGHGASLELVRIPSGTFLLGSPEKERLRARDPFHQHEVTIGRDFLLGRHEITRGQFAAFVEAAKYETDAERQRWAFAWDGKKWDRVEKASWKAPGFDQADDHPAVCVSFNDAVAFCKWLTCKSGKTVRLPTEAEWEYAARAGTTTAYVWGDEPDDGQGWCNVADLTGKARFRPWKTFKWEDGHVFTAPVGSFKPNAFGLFDVHGNVWEWCADFYAEQYPEGKQTDPRGPDEGSRRVIRGGSWLSTTGRARSAARESCPPPGGVCDLIVGFRVVVELPCCCPGKEEPARCDKTER